MSSLEDKLIEILDAGLGREEMVCRLAKTFLQHAPRRFDDWSNYLRRIADFIDNQPKPVMLTSKQIGALISLGGFK